MKRTWMTGMLAVALVGTVPVAHSAETNSPPEKLTSVERAKRRDADVKVITEQLASSDPQKVEAAIAVIWQDFAKNPDAATLALSKWAQPLILAKRYDDVATLALTGTVVSAGTLAQLETVLQIRVRALISAGRREEMLAAAKSLYNVCRMSSTSAAIDLVAKALSTANNHDAGIAKKFRLEQVAGASTNAPADAPKDPPLLAAIKVDSAPYQAAIDSYLHATSFKAASLCALGNLYLLADQPKQAEERFRQALDWNPTPTDLVAATEGIARCMRAQDGTVRRANAWIVEQRNQGK